MYKSNGVTMCLKAYDGGLRKETDAGLKLKRRLFENAIATKRVNRRKAVWNTNIRTNNVVIKSSPHRITIPQI